VIWALGGVGVDGRRNQYGKESPHVPTATTSCIAEGTITKYSQNPTFVKPDMVGERVDS